MRLRRVLAETVVGLRLWTRNGYAMAMGLVFPLFLLLLLGAFAGGGQSFARVHVQDLDGTPESRLLVAYLEGSGAIEVSLDGPPPGVGVEQWMVDGRIVGYLEIPQGHGEEVRAGRSANLTLYVDDTRPPQNGIIRGIVANAVQRRNLDLTGEEPILGMATQSVRSIPEPSYREFLLPGILGANVVSIGFFNASANATGMRRSRMFKRLAATPMTKTEWIVAKVVVQTIAVAAGSALLLPVAVLAFDIEVSLHPASALLLVAGAAAFAGLGIFIGGAIRNPDAASTLTTLVAVPMMFVSGTFFATASYPTLLQTLVRLLPLTYVTEGLRSAMILDEPSVAATNALIVTGIAALFIGLGAAFTEWRDD